MYNLIELQNMRLDRFINIVSENKELRYFLFSLDSDNLFNYPRLEDHIQNYADTIGYVEHNGFRMGTTYRYRIIDGRTNWYDLNNEGYESDDAEDRKYHR
jgi:hypothetical protein